MEATGACKLAVLSQLNYKKTIEVIQKKQIESRICFFGRIPIFCELTPSQLHNSLYYLSTIHYTRGKTVYFEGSTADKLFIVKKGVFDVIILNLILDR